MSDGHIRQCPRCITPMDKLVIADPSGDVVLDACGGCHGVYVNAIAMGHLIVDRPPSLCAALVARFASAVHDPVLEKRGEMYVHCPDCHTIMNRQLFSLHVGVVVDSCRGHGVWFDPGELSRVVEFVARGGALGVREAIHEAHHAARTSIAPPATPTLANVFSLLWHTAASKPPTA